MIIFITIRKIMPIAKNYKKKLKFILQYSILKY